MNTEYTNTEIFINKWLEHLNFAREHTASNNEIIANYWGGKVNVMFEMLEELAEQIGKTLALDASGDVVLADFTIE